MTIITRRRERVVQPQEPTILRSEWQGRLIALSTPVGTLRKSGWSANSYTGSVPIGAGQFGRGFDLSPTGENKVLFSNADRPNTVVNRFYLVHATFKWRNTAAFGTIFGLYTGAAYVFTIGRFTNGSLRCHAGSGEVFASGARYLEDGRDYTIAMTIGGSSGQGGEVYINGVYAGKGSPASPVSTTRAPAIGALDGTTGFEYNGLVYSAGIWEFGEARPAQADLLSLTDNPFQIYKPIERRIWVPVSAGGGSVTHSLTASGLAQAAATAMLDVQAGGATVDLGATGSAQASAAASLLKGVSLASAGLAVATGGASVAHVVPLQASAVAVAQAGAGLALGVTLSAAGLAQAAGAAALSTSSGLELAAGAQAQASGGAVLSLVVNLSAAGVAQALAAAGLAQGVPLAAAGLAQAGGSAALQVGAPLDLAAAGGAQASAGASLWVDVPLSAAALAQAVAAGSLQLSVPLAAAALAQAGGSAVLAGAVTLAAGGQALATGGAALQVMGALDGVTKGLRLQPPVRRWGLEPAGRVWQMRQRRRVWRMADAGR